MFEFKIEDAGSIPDNDSIFKTYYHQLHNLKYIMCEVFHKKDYDDIVLFILDLDCLYRSLHICSALGKIEDYDNLSKLYKNKMDDFITNGLPAMRNLCEKIHNEKKNTKLN